MLSFDLELGDDMVEEQHSYTCQDQSVFQQIQAQSSGTETSQEQPSIIQEYVLPLCRFEAVTMLNYERFCLPNLSGSQHKLLEKSYVFIERKTHTIHGGGACWLYTCSCDSRRSSLVNSLASDLHLGSADCFDFLGEDCSHVEAF